MVVGLPWDQSIIATFSMNYRSDLIMSTGELQVSSCAAKCPSQSVIPACFEKVKLRLLVGRVPSVAVVFYLLLVTEA